MSLEVEGLNGTIRAFQRAGEALADAAENQSKDLASQEATRIKARAASTGKMERLAARSVRSAGTAIEGAAGSGVPAAIFYGAEFGGQRRPTTQQFRPFRGQIGYWFWPQLRDDEGRIANAWSDALEDVEKDFRR